MPKKKPAPRNRATKRDGAQADKRPAKNAAKGFGTVADVSAVTSNAGPQSRDHFWLSPAQTDVVLNVPGISQALKARIQSDQSSLTMIDVHSLIGALLATLSPHLTNDVDALTRQSRALVMRDLLIRLDLYISNRFGLTAGKQTSPKAKVDASALYQFKITLVGSNPPIWRRIQVGDCTLDKLHEHIQTAMGWTNSHLHHFRLGKQLYGDPMLMEENMEEMDYKDSTRTKISTILPKTGKRFSFTYEYDFGDGWEHEIVFEGCPMKEPGAKYPLCLEGERACPPEDVGGIGGFYEFLKALANPKHEQHEVYVDWVGDFDPERFDARQATKDMKKGLPNWREW